MSYLDDTPVQKSDERSDEEVLAAARIAPAEFEILVDRYQEAFLRKVRHLLPWSPEAAEDLVQETFVKIYAHSDKFAPQEGASFKSWAYKILVNTCFTYYKKRKRERLLVSELEPDALAEMESGADALFQERKLDTDEVLSLVSRLPALLGRALRLYVLEDRSQKEIARMEGISDGAVRARIHRAKRELRKFRDVSPGL